MEVLFGQKKIILQYNGPESVGFGTSEIMLLTGHKIRAKHCSPTECVLQFLTTGASKGYGPLLPGIVQGKLPTIANFSANRDNRI